MDLFTNKVQFDAEFSERLKLKDDAVLSADYIGFDSNVATHNLSNCFYYVVTIALSVITDRLICTEYLCVFNLQCPSVKDVDCQTYTTISQS